MQLGIHDNHLHCYVIGDNERGYGDPDAQECGREEYARVQDKHDCNEQRIA